MTEILAPKIIADLQNMLERLLYSLINKTFLWKTASLHQVNPVLKQENHALIGKLFVYYT